MLRYGFDAAQMQTGLRWAKLLADLRHKGQSMPIKDSLIAATALGCSTLAGVLIFYLIGTNLGYTVQYALPLAGGVTLYVAASDLIPEVNHHGGRSPWVSLSVFAGVALFFATHELLHAVME